MNSISAKLTAASIASTAKLLRSAKKEIIFIVEGDDDIALFSNCLSLPKANFISCFGKERLMQVFQLVPHAGLDAGTIFLRDSDCDAMPTQLRRDVLLIASDYYDFEMSLLPNRVFGRIFGEFLKRKATPQNTKKYFDIILRAASIIGAMRLLSHTANLNLDFKDANLSFIDASSLTNNIGNMVQYFYARSRVTLDDKSAIVERLNGIIKTAKMAPDITSGKDFLRILSLALNRHFKCCNANECNFETLARMFRMIVIHDDIKQLKLYPHLHKQVATSSFAWVGVPL
jgi:hypothetical protein